MAVPSSGELSLQGISKEMLQNDYNYANNTTNVSLAAMSTSISPYNVNSGSTDKPDGVAPHKMSEFYGYDNDAVNVTAFTSSTKGTTSTACSLSLNQTYYHDGAGATPVLGDFVYTDAALTNALEGGWYKVGLKKIEIKPDFTFPTPIYTGEVLNVVTC